jgi:aerobic carbon-monoxide dehydrogenase medium subunit
MKPARFSYEAPATLEAALASLARRPDDARVIAGGQSLAPMMNMRLAQPGHLIDINGIAELGTVARDGDRIVVGALVRHADLARDPLVRLHCPIAGCAASSIGHYAIRQRGTLGGSLAHADPAAQLPVVALALDAELEVASTRGRRMVAASQFFVSLFTTALAADELLTAARFPVMAPNEGWGFRLFARRAGDFALAAVAAILTRRPNEGVENLRLAVGGIGPVPVRLEAAAQAAATGPADAAWAARVAQAAARAAEIEPNERVAVAYRRELVAVLVQDALTDALERAR